MLHRRRRNSQSPPVCVDSYLPYLTLFLFVVDACNFCFSDKSDDYLLGELLRHDDLTTHRFCLYFAPCLTQGDDPNEGICGFSPKDIRKELRRGTQLKCAYCQQRGAVVGWVKLQLAKLHFCLASLNYLVCDHNP